MSTGKTSDVLVVGAGLAGLSAAVALAGDHARVTVLERRPTIGGRAYSYLHPALEEVVDSQHVLLGCCTNLLDFCDAAGLNEQIRWYDSQTFLEPATAGRPVRRSSIELGPLPAPLQYSGSFLRAAMLSPADKLSVARGLAGLARGNHESDDGSVAQWYRRTQQTAGAIRHFWEPIVLATLNDNSEQSSMRYAGKVFYELFLKTATGGRLGIPTVPLSQFYAGGVDLLEQRGGRVALRAGVDQLCQQPGGGWQVVCGEDTYTARSVILAAPFEQTARLLDKTTLAEPSGSHLLQELETKIARFIHAPFISVLLWFDRQITDLPHAWLLDTTIQWFFHKSMIRGYPAEQGSYVELVIAGSRTELPLSRAEILAPALAELERFFPEVRHARLLKTGILKEARATFSVTPGLDPYRPLQATGVDGLYIAGDWTATDWPSTMESAVRSGRLAAGAAAGDRERYLKPELPASGVMGWLARE